MFDNSLEYCTINVMAIEGVHLLKIKSKQKSKLSFSIDTMIRPDCGLNLLCLTPLTM